MGKHTRMTIVGPYDVQNQARCSNFGQRQCTGACPRHDPVGYSECMARHATDSSMPTRFYVYSGSGSLVQVETTNHAALSVADYLTRRLPLRGPFTVRTM